MENAYDKNVAIWKKAYTEIKEVCEKYGDEFSHSYGFGDINSAKQDAEKHLGAIELYDKYGVRVEYSHYGSNRTRIDDYRTISFYDGKNRNISWSDDGKQPEDEELYAISFPTGPYIFDSGNMFNRDYPKEHFQKFFEELKKYNPKYLDTVNHCLYFTMDNAKKIHNDFRGILKKYHDQYARDTDKRRIKKLESELAMLKAKS